MTDKPENSANGSEEYCREVYSLAEQVKMMALNIAVNLAKSKNDAGELTILEPEFTKLVTGSVDVVKEVAVILKAFRNEEKMVFSPRDNDRNLERIEKSLNEILKLSQSVLNSIAVIKSEKKQIDSYNK